MKTTQRCSAVLMFCLLFGAGIAMSTMQSADQTIAVIPKPLTMKKESGSFTLSASTTIVAVDADLKRIAEMLAEQLRVSTGLPLPVEANGSRSG